MWSVHEERLRFYVRVPGRMYMRASQVSRSLEIASFRAFRGFAKLGVATTAVTTHSYVDSLYCVYGEDRLASLKMEKFFHIRIIFLTANLAVVLSKIMLIKDATDNKTKKNK